jgi:S-adenosylmethionine hydrolase
MQAITLTSDLGMQDIYLAAVKGSLLTHLSDVQIVDITHQVPNFDIFKAAELLRHSYTFFPKGTVHCILVNTASHLKTPILLGKYDGHFFLGPDNGMFSFLFEEQPEILIRINENSFIQKTTFPFIDFYLPALKQLLSGEGMENIGIPIDSYTTRSLFNAFGQGDQVHGYIWHVDRFGNCISNINKALFERIGKGRKFAIDLKGFENNTINFHYDEKPSGQISSFFNFMGLFEIAINSGSAAQLLNLHRNDKIIIRFGDDF